MCQDIDKHIQHTRVGLAAGRLLEVKLLGAKEAEACLRFFAQQLQTMQSSGSPRSCTQIQELWMVFANSLSESHLSQIIHRSFHCSWIATYLLNNTVQHDDVYDFYLIIQF